MRGRQRSKKALSEAFGEIDYDVDEIQFVPQTTVALSGDDALTSERFLGMLNDVDDVQNVYHSAAL